MGIFKVMYFSCLYWYVLACVYIIHRRAILFMCMCMPSEVGDVASNLSNWIKQSWLLTAISSHQLKNKVVAKIRMWTTLPRLACAVVHCRLWDV